MKHTQTILMTLLLFTCIKTSCATAAPIVNLTTQQVNALTKDSNIKKGIKSVNKSQFDKAEKYYLKASKKQNILGDYNLGVLYGKTKFKRHSETTAIKWLLKAAQHGLVYTQYDLGIKYMYGDGSIRNGKKAIYWLEIARKQGYNKAQSSLGEIQTILPKGCLLVQFGARTRQFFPCQIKTYL